MLCRISLYIVHLVGGGCCQRSISVFRLMCEFVVCIIYWCDYFAIALRNFHCWMAIKLCARFFPFFFCFSNKRRLLQLLKWAILLKMLCVLFVISVLVALNRKTINKMQMRVFHFQARNRQVHKHAMEHKQYSNNNRVVCWKLARESKK